MKASFKRIYLPLCLISTILVVSACDDDDNSQNPGIQYPETGFYGDNILMKGKKEYSGQFNSLQAKLPPGKEVKIIITGKTVNFPNGVWYYEGGSSNNWAVLKFNMVNFSQVFQSIDGGHTCDLSIQFDVGSYQIDYYEDGEEYPTYSKTIEVAY